MATIQPLPANQQIPLPGTIPPRSEERTYTFSELLEASGLSKKRADYWSGDTCPILIPSVRRTAGGGKRGMGSGLRIYSEADIRKAKLFREMFDAGYKIRHLRQFFDECLAKGNAPILDPDLSPGGGFVFWFQDKSREGTETETGWMVTIQRRADDPSRFEVSKCTQPTNPAKESLLPISISVVSDLFGKILEGGSMVPLLEAISTANTDKVKAACALYTAGQLTLEQLESVRAEAHAMSKMLVDTMRTAIDRYTMAKASYEKEKAVGVDAPTARKPQPDSAIPEAPRRAKDSTPHLPLSLRRLEKVEGVKAGKQRQKGVASHAKHRTANARA